MNRIATKFQDLQNVGHKGFIPFVTAGDPDLETSLSIVIKLAEMGADVIELGSSVQRSDGGRTDDPAFVAAGVGRWDDFSDVLKFAAEFRKRSDVPIVLFSYFNPIMRFWDRAIY